MSLRQRFPVSSAAALYAVVVALAFWPFWTGHFLINPMSDMRNGYPFRLFEAEYMRQVGGFPQWNPYIFGGMPFIGAIGGDVFYPTFLLRLVLPVDVGVTLGFMLHIVLAGVFTFMFLRALKLEWGAAFVGGAAYMFTGQVVSLVSPGHDGKLFVSALLPLTLLFLYRAVVRNDWRHYLYFGAAVGVCLISPHFQMTYYALMAAGFFWAFLVFASHERPAVPWLRSALLFGLALGVGFAIAAVQLVPFQEYLAYAARGAAKESADRWGYATSWAMPPEELFNVVWPAFSGILDQYWGRNFFKLHSEYLGVVVLVLATFAPFLREKRRLAWFFVFLGAYGILFALGGHTPFYRIPYALLPGIKLTRAPSMIFFLTAFSTAALAAFGTQALLTAQPGTPPPKTPLWWWAGGTGVAALLAFAGGFQGIMRGLADPQRMSAVMANYPAFEMDVVRVLVLTLAAAALCALRLSDRIAGARWSLLMGALVLVDLWTVERRYIKFSPPARESFASDAVVRTLRADSGLYRVLSLNEYQGLENYFMSQHIRSVLGYHGNELQRYDELLGGKNEWRNIGSPNLLKLLAVHYVVLSQPVQTPILSAVGSGPLTTVEGQPAYVYRVSDPLPYAFLVGEALQWPDSEAVSTVLDPRFDLRRILLVSPDQHVGLTTIDQHELPAPLTTPVAVHELRAGALRFDLGAPPAEPAYLFVSENYHPAWHAVVDGRPVGVVRAQYSLMAVPLPAGARSVQLAFSSPAVRQGEWVTVVALLLVLATIGVDVARRRASRRSGGTGRDEERGG